MNMYYVAILAPEEIDTQVLKWKHYFREKFDCSVALRSPAHITLIPPFWMKQESEADLINTISEFSQTAVSFEIHLKDFSAFKPKVIFVDIPKNEKLEMLHDSFNRFVISKDKFPVKKDDRPFHPHITLATRDLFKKAFFETWEKFAAMRFEATWRVTGISLLKHNKKKWEVIFSSGFPD
jgi:2'-5' RNA ligase